MTVSRVSYHSWSWAWARAILGTLFVCAQGSSTFAAGCHVAEGSESVTSRAVWDLLSMGLLPAVVGAPAPPALSPPSCPGETPRTSGDTNPLVGQALDSAVVAACLPSSPMCLWTISLDHRAPMHERLDRPPRDVRTPSPLLSVPGR